MAHLSADEVRDKYVRAMGPQLGSMYYALWNELVLLHAKWQQYRQLYGHSPERISLLNESAPFFFRVLQDVLWEDILLHIARLTDPLKSAGKDNLTLRRLESVIADAVVAGEIRLLVQGAVGAASFARDWRNRRLAHRDLGLVLKAGATQLEDASRQKVEKVLAAFRAGANKLATHFCNAEEGFEHFQAIGDADALLYHLRVARESEERKMQRLREGRLLLEDLKPPSET